MGQVVQREAEASLVHISHSSQFSGPIPPPKLMAEYQELIPDAPERILRLAELQADHRRTIESKVIDNEIIRSRRGLQAGFVVAMTMAIGGIWIALTVAPPAGPLCGATMTGSTLVGLVYTFITGTRSRREERESKAKALAKRRK